MRFFHGGKPGLKPGDFIVPGNDAAWRVPGCPDCDAGVDDNHLPNKVFITASREYARYYASRAVGGDLYVVTPLGPIEPSSNDMGITTWSCDRARVVSVYERYVKLTRAQRWRVFKMGTPAGEHPDRTRRAFEQMELRGQAIAAATRLRMKEAQEINELDDAIDDGWNAIGGRPDA